MKDPAFLFYPDNFMSGTMFLSNEQVGKYIRLLCAQHLTGHLCEEDMLKICLTQDKDIFKKFTKDEQGNYYNARLEAEILKRRNYSESRSLNRKGHFKEKNKQSKHKRKEQSYDNHMGNENGDGNVFVLDNEKELKNNFSLIEQIGRTFNQTPERVNQYLEQFISEQKAADSFAHRELKDLKSHFPKWLKIQLTKPQTKKEIQYPKIGIDGKYIKA